MGRRRAIGMLAAAALSALACALPQDSPVSDRPASDPAGRGSAERRPSASSGTEPTADRAYCRIDPDTTVRSEFDPLDGRTLAISTLDSLFVLDSEGARPLSGADRATFSWDRSGEGLFVASGGRLRYVPLNGDAELEIYAGWRHVRFPSLAPDGATLAVSVNETTDTSRGWWIWLVGRHGEDPRPLVQGYHPSWSPDGATLYVEQHEPSIHLAVYDVDSGRVSALLPEADRDVSVEAGSGIDRDVGVEVSPRGTYAAFSRGHDRRLMLYTFADSSVSELTDGTFFDQYPSFSPQEDYVVFHRQYGSPQGTPTLQIVACELATGRSVVVREGWVLGAAYSPVRGRQ